MFGVLMPVFVKNTTLLKSSIIYHAWLVLARERSLSPANLARLQTRPLDVGPRLVVEKSQNEEISRLRYQTSYAKSQDLGREVQAFDGHGQTPLQGPACETWLPRLVSSPLHQARPSCWGVR